MKDNNQLQRKGCSSRASFDTEQQCIEAVRNAYITRHVTLNYYLCHKCNKWHLYNPRYADMAKQFAVQCLNKKVYYSLDSIKKVAQKVFEERGIKLHAYRCPHCGHYHLTKKVQNINCEVF